LFFSSAVFLAVAPFPKTMAKLLLSLSHCVLVFSDEVYCCRPSRRCRVGLAGLPAYLPAGLFASKNKNGEKLSLDVVKLPRVLCKQSKRASRKDFLYLASLSLSLSLSCANKVLCL
jgi:hypothetical protein